MNLTCEDPDKRYDLEKIKNSDWYQGEVYDEKEVKDILEPQLQENKNK